MNKELSKNKLKALLKRHFPKNKNFEIKRITEGYSHYMYDARLDNKNVILRISFNRKEEVSLHKEEWMIKQYKKTGAPVPKIYAIKSEKYFDYMILEKFNGENLEKIWKNLSQKERMQTGVEIGKLLRKLHSITFEDFGEKYSSEECRLAGGDWVKYLIEKKTQRMLKEQGRELNSEEKETMEKVNSFGFGAYFKKPYLVPPKKSREQRSRTKTLGYMQAVDQEGLVEEFILAAQNLEIRSILVNRNGKEKSRFADAVVPDLIAALNFIEVRT